MRLFPRLEPCPRPAPVRHWAAALTVTVAAVTAAPGVAVLVRQHLLPGPFSAAWMSSSVIAALLGSAAAARWRPRRVDLPSWVLVLAPVVGAALVTWWGEGRFSAASATVLLVGIPAGLAVEPLAARVPCRLDEVASRRPVAAAIFLVAALLLVVQCGRLATYMTDPQSDWWLTTRHELWAKHMCLPAYVQAADLHRQGEANVYDARNYLGLNRDARPRYTVENIESFAGDPFQYPPTFLAAAVVALGASNDFLVLRALWFSVEALAVLLVIGLLARWLVPESTAAAWLAPVVLLSVPSLQALQFGQVHSAVIALAIGALLAFESRREALGGLLLASAVLAKMFPAPLVLLLLLQRRWRAAAWTVAWGIALSAAAWALLGTAPFSAFFTYELPRLADGRAFAFLDAWPEWRGWVLADNLSPYGLVMKLGELGFPAMTSSAARLVARIYAVVLVASVLLAAGVNGSRTSRAVAWLALLGLASLQSLYAWGDYVTFPAVWLLSILPLSAYAGWRSKVLLAVCWVFFALLPGVVPMPSLMPSRIALPLTAAGTLLLVAFNLVVLVRARREPAQLQDVN